MESKSSKYASLKYHDIFNYPLTKEEIKKWTTVGFKNFSEKISFSGKNEYFFLNGREGIVKTRILNEKYSRKKLVIAKKASKLIANISTIRFVGITGALAMNNASREGDIDLMIITRKKSLWTSRILVYFVLWIAGYKLRVPKQKNEKNKLCINLWLDESDTVWHKNDRNIYTAHEVAQIVPLFNKNKMYELFLNNNKWILKYWPKAVNIKSKSKNKYESPSKLFKLIEYISFKIQLIYMKSKITREIVTPTRAIFHPNDWGKIVLDKLSS